MVAKWSSLPGEEHVPVARYMTDFSLKLALFSQFGSHVFTDEEILEIRHYYDIVCVYLNLRKLPIVKKAGRSTSLVLGDDDVEPSSMKDLV